MTAIQMTQVLKNKGFNARATNDTVIVSLKRPINTMEVWTALDYQVEQERMVRDGKAVMIR